MKKKLTITIDYNTDDNPDEYRVLKEELESVMDKLSIGSNAGYESHDIDDTGKEYVITEFKIEEV